MDNVEHPKHYAGSTSLECIDAMTITFGTDAVEVFCLCSAYKYMWRYKNKNGMEDLKKAKWYLDYVWNYGVGVQYIDHYEEMVKLLNKFMEEENGE